MANNKTTVRFWLRTDRPNQDGTCPVHLVYQIQQQRKYFALTDIKVLPFNWNIKEQKAILYQKPPGKKKAESEIPTPTKAQEALLLSADEVEEVNGKLSQVRYDIREVIETRCRLDGETITPDLVIERLKELRQPEVKKDQPGKLIVDFIERFIKETTKHKKGTLKEYQTLANHMSEFEKLHKTKFTFEGDAAILNSFSNYLTDITGMNNITKAKMISTFKTILRHAKKPPYKIKSNPDYLEVVEKREDDEFEVIALTEDEFLQIYNLDLSGNKSLDEARDIFCFACMTGLRYQDLSNLRHVHITKDNMIKMSASKNQKKIAVPLNPYSHAILKKYKDTLHPLPVKAHNQKMITNQKLNVNIKKIGELAGVDTPIEKLRPFGTKMRPAGKGALGEGVYKKYELLSIHVGRKTFTTLNLEKGVAIQEVMALTTHSSFKAVKRYIDVTNQRKKTVMANAWGKIKPDNLKAV